jgi:hypothetical protein
VGAVANPPPFEHFATDTADSPSDGEYAETCMNLIVMQVNFDLGVLKRQLGIVHPDIEAWIVKAIHALNRTKGETSTEFLPLDGPADFLLKRCS